MGAESGVLAATDGNNEESLYNEEIQRLAFEMTSDTGRVGYGLESKEGLNKSSYGVKQIL